MERASSQLEAEAALADGDMAGWSRELRELRPLGWDVALGVWVSCATIVVGCHQGPCVRARRV
jgi:hypothetical protein